MKNFKLAGLSANERTILRHFTKTEQATYGPDDITAIVQCSRVNANKILSRLCKKGWLQRLKHGVYGTVPISSNKPDPIVEDAWSLAMDIYKPAFISGWSAAEHWDLTEQIFNGISVVTTKSQRRITQVVGNVHYRIRSLPDERFFGSRTIWFGSRAVEIADPSRMLIDILDLPRMGGGGRHTLDIVREYWQSDINDPDLLLRYALKYRKGSVFKRLGFSAEATGAPVTAEWLSACRENISKGITAFDPDGSGKGPIISKWNLKSNVPV